jgi:HTH-type transcriptional regulator/antitoxin HigA
MSTSTGCLELVKIFPPRPITSEAEWLAAQQVIDSLLDKGELSPDERDYLSVLGTLVYEYEENQRIVPDIGGMKFAKVLVTEFGLRHAIFLTLPTHKCGGFLHLVTRSGKGASRSSS